jgi:hypothetical protein
VKQYLLFAGEEYYPRGGMQDFRGDFDALNDAQAAGAVFVEAEILTCWWHVYDTQQRRIVAGTGRTYGGGEHDPEATE